MMLYDNSKPFRLMLFVNIGANYVRGAHYPQDPRWLDLLDENGLVMWSETLGPGVTTEKIKDDRFMKYQIKQLGEMLDNALNHAAIMTWGWFNEGPSDDPEACVGYAANTEYARGRDPTRFYTYASHVGLDDVCWETVSLVSMNKYPGCYETFSPTM